MKEKISSLIIAVLLVLVVLLVGCSRFRHKAEFKPDIQPLPAPLKGIDPKTIPKDEALTPEKVALGRELFFDERLSHNGNRSCSSCHLCDKGLTDGLAKGVDAFNKPLKRNSPTLWNIGYHSEFAWDGNKPTIDAQTKAAWTGPNMGAKPDEILKKINAIDGYRQQFQKVFGATGAVTQDHVVKAIVAFERTIISSDSAWERFRAGDQSALSESARRGYQVFKDAKCTNCHDGLLITDLQYHNVGIGMDQKEPTDLGRSKVTNKVEDTGAFKTPTLLDVARSGPYFHDGSVKTLDEAVNIMLGGGKPNEHLDKKNLQPHTISKEQRDDLLAFLNSLNVDCKLTKPTLPPK